MGICLDLVISCPSAKFRAYEEIILDSFITAEVSHEEILYMQLSL